MNIRREARFQKREHYYFSEFRKRKRLYLSRQRRPAHTNTYNPPPRLPAWYNATCHPLWHKMSPSSLRHHHECHLPRHCRFRRLCLRRHHPSALCLLYPRTSLYRFHILRVHAKQGLQNRTVHLRHNRL